MGAQALGNQVVWFDIPCHDLSRAIKFYSAVLGCQIERQGSPEFEMGILPHSNNTVGGCLYADAPAAGSTQGVLVYLNCQGRLDEAIAAAAAHGGITLVEKHEIGPHGFRTIILDSEGNRVALHSM